MRGCLQSIRFWRGGTVQLVNCIDNLDNLEDRLVLQA